MYISSVQPLSRVQLFVTPCTAAHQASLSITNSQSLLKLVSIESMMPSNHLILSHPLFLPPSIFPRISVFSNESVLHIRWPKYWSFSFSISPSNEYSGLISFRMDWLDLLAVQGALKSLLQHHSSKASIFWRSAFFIVQLSHPYMTAGKTIALTRRTVYNLRNDFVCLDYNFSEWQFIQARGQSPVMQTLVDVCIYFNLFRKATGFLKLAWRLPPQTSRVMFHRNRANLIK